MPCTYAPTRVVRRHDLRTTRARQGQSSRAQRKLIRDVRAAAAATPANATRSGGPITGGRQYEGRNQRHDWAQADRDSEGTQATPAGPIADSWTTLPCRAYVLFLYGFVGIL